VNALPVMHILLASATHIFIAECCLILEDVGCKVTKPKNSVSSRDGTTLDVWKSN